MKVLLISHTCQSRTEGQPKAQCLGRMPGVELRLLTPIWWRHYGKWRRAEIPDDPSYAFSPQRARWPWLGPAQCYLHWYPQLAAILREFRPDIIDLWEEPWGLVSSHACWLRNRLLPSAKIIAETEQNTARRLPFPFERFRSYTLRNADFLVARNTEAITIANALGYDGPAEVVPNAVDAELFRPMDRTSCRRALGLEGFVAGYVGRLTAEKGLMDLLDALPLCPADVNLLFVGTGSLEGALRGKARNGRVRFLPARPLEQLPEVMNALDVLVLPSRTTGRWKEQFGRVIIEAHACGVPVIGSDSGAIPEVIGSGGLVFPEGDIAQLARAIAAFHADGAAAEEAGRVGREQVLNQYTWQRVAERMYAIYGRVLGGQGGRANRSNVQGERNKGTRARPCEREGARVSAEVRASS